MSNQIIEIQLPFTCSVDKPSGYFLFNAYSVNNGFRVWSAYVLDLMTMERHPLDEDNACELFVDSLQDVYACLSSDISPILHPASIYECS